MTSTPLWLNLLGPGLVFFGLVIAFYQWRTNHQKVVLDLFDRRYKIFEQAKSVISGILYDGKVTDKQLSDLKVLS